MLNIQENIELAYYTTFKIGGRARYFVEVGNKNELREALEHALKNKLDFFVLGGGSNILISDNGFNGLIIKLGTKTELNFNGNDLIECFAGNNLSEIVNFARSNSLSGLEWAIGIPGTIGGAVRGNAGAFDGDMKNVIEKVECICVGEDLEEKTFSGDECDFKYRSSIFKNNPSFVIVSAILKLKEENKENIQNKMKEVVFQRNEKNPREAKSAGSFFMNPMVENEELLEKFAKDSGKKSANNMISAGWLIQEAGLTEERVGGAAISEKHANFIMNTGSATAEDVVMLASIIKQKVRTKFGVQLVEEVKLLGF